MAASTNEHAEMYLKTIRCLSGERPARTTEISSHLGLSPSSVTEMLQKLKKEGLVLYTSYKGSTLTTRGKKIASRLVRRERVLKRFLHDVLKIPSEHLEEQACRLEHYITDETEHSLRRFLGCYPNCPACRTSEPNCDLCREESSHV